MPGLVAPAGDERAGLMAFLARQRYALRLASYGLTDDQARATPSASSLSLGGLIKHVARAERRWMDNVLERRERADVDYAEAFRVGPGETLAGVLDIYQRTATETDAIIDGIPDLDQTVPVPQDVPGFPGVDAWPVRWVLLYLIEETARHAGHADIVRESIDGATALRLMAAAEGWPATPGVTPWQPPVY